MLVTPMCLHQPYYFLLLNCDQIEKQVVVAKADETGLGSLGKSLLASSVAMVYSNQPPATLHLPPIGGMHPWMAPIMQLSLPSFNTSSNLL